MIYNELMSDFEMDEKDFTADSWSLAVDGSFLHQHKKEVMKQQDVIYGEPPLPLPGPAVCPPSASPTSQDPRLGPLVTNTLPNIPQVASGPCLLGPLGSKALCFSLPSSQFLVFPQCLSRLVPC